MRYYVKGKVLIDPDQAIHVEHCQIEKEQWIVIIFTLHKGQCFRKDLHRK